MTPTTQTQAGGAFAEQIAHTVEVDLDHPRAIDAVTAALGEQGFGD